jgi:hypothetical protein
MPRSKRFENKKRSFSWKLRLLRTLKDLIEILPAMKRLAFEVFAILSFFYTLYKIARYR